MESIRKQQENTLGGVSRSALDENSNGGMGDGGGGKRNRQSSN